MPWPHVQHLRDRLLEVSETYPKLGSRIHLFCRMKPLKVQTLTGMTVRLFGWNLLHKLSAISYCDGVQWSRLAFEKCVTTNDFLKMYFFNGKTSHLPVTVLVQHLYFKVFLVEVFYYYWHVIPWYCIGCEKLIWKVMCQPILLYDSDCIMCMLLGLRALNVKSIADLSVQNSVNLLGRACNIHFPLQSLCTYFICCMVSNGRQFQHWLTQ